MESQTNLAPQASPQPPAAQPDPHPQAGSLSHVGGPGVAGPTNVQSLYDKNGRLTHAGARLAIAGGGSVVMGVPTGGKGEDGKPIFRHQQFSRVEELPTQAQLAAASGSTEDLAAAKAKLEAELKVKQAELDELKAAQKAQGAAGGPAPAAAKAPAAK